MLVHIAIKNLAIVKRVDLPLSSGLTAITGETGAGKSIALDALGLCLGDRADSSIVRDGADKAEVVAHFDITHIAKAQHFLSENELLQEDNPEECFIRRVISSEGRSKAFVNGIPVNLAQIKQLGAYLASIYSQHAHHQFLKAENQRLVLDQYAKHDTLLTDLATQFQNLNHAKKQLTELNAHNQQRLERTQLLSYQVEELDEFSLAEDEFETLELDVKKLNNFQDLISYSQQALQALNSDPNSNAIGALNTSIKALNEVANMDENAQPILDGLYDALHQVEEAHKELLNYEASLEADPEKLAYTEERYGKCLDLARKHKVSPEQLFATHMELIAELETIKSQQTDLLTLKDKVEELEKNYQAAALKLSKSRNKAASALSKEIQMSVREMNLPHAIIDTQVRYDESKPASKQGNDEVQIMLSVNPGQAVESIDKVVSGGELSRIGLAIQVISSKDNLIPTMVFDEVDTGISGHTAALVGKLLKKLGANAQVLCVTHLPQVAAQAHHQLFVSKVTDGKTTETNLLKLTNNERVNEIARLLAGDELTDTAIANAKDLLKL